MELLKSAFAPNGKNPPYIYHEFAISSSFEKELKRCIKLEVIRLFGYGANYKNIYLKFVASKEFGSPKTIEELQPKVLQNSKDKSYLKYFCFGLNNAYAHFPELIIENTLKTGPILDLTKEVELNSLKMTLVFDDRDFRSSLELIDRARNGKGIVTLDEYAVPIVVKSPSLDCHIKINFKQSETVTLKSLLIENIEERIHSFNINQSNGLIHNIIDVKSDKRKSKYLTLTIDLGSAGEEGLEMIYKQLETYSEIIEVIEVF